MKAIYYALFLAFRLHIVSVCQNCKVVRGTSGIGQAVQSITFFVECKNEILESERHCFGYVVEDKVGPESLS